MPTSVRFQVPDYNAGFSILGLNMQAEAALTLIPENEHVTIFEPSFDQSQLQPTCKGSYDFRLLDFTPN